MYWIRQVGVSRRKLASIATWRLYLILVSIAILEGMAKNSLSSPSPCCNVFLQTWRIHSIPPVFQIWTALENRATKLRNSTTIVFKFGSRRNFSMGRRMNRARPYTKCTSTASRYFQLFETNLLFWHYRMSLDSNGTLSSAEGGVRCLLQYMV